MGCAVSPDDQLLSVMVSGQQLVVQELASGHVVFDTPRNTVRLTLL